MGFVEEVRRHRHPDFRQVPLCFASSLVSTNDRALDLAEEGTPEGTAVFADTQTQGRGRLGRVWFSPPGRGLYGSIVVRPTLSSDVSQLTLLAGVSVATAVEALCGVAPRLKWPNDIQIEGKKVGGILTESRAGEGQLDYTVVGVGLNVTGKREDFPPELRSEAGSIFETTAKMVERAPLAARLLDEFEIFCRRWRRESFAPIREAWRKKSSTLGRRVRTTDRGRQVEGTALDLAEDGALLIETTAGRLSLRTGEIVELEALPSSL